MGVRGGQAAASVKVDPRARCRSDATGEDACPFTTLYWDFLSRNRSRLRGNRRMGFQLRNLDLKSASERRQIRARAGRLKSELTKETWL